MLRIKRLKGNSAVISFPLPLGQRIMERLGWNEFEKLGFGWEKLDDGYVLRFWRQSDGECRFQKWKNLYEVCIPNFPIEDELVVKKVKKDDSPWLDPMLVMEVEVHE